MIETILSDIPQNDWVLIEKKSLEVLPRLLRLTWHSNKGYVPNPPNDGFEEQKIFQKDYPPEQPYFRDIFQPSSGRFSLLERKPIAYFSCDIGVCFLETQFFEKGETNSTTKRKDLSFDHWWSFLRGESNPCPDFYGYPLTYRLLPTARIFDITRNSSPFFNSLARGLGKHSSSELFDEIYSKDEKHYPLTQKISEAVYWQGFNGLLYRSVRCDNTNILPWNLVLFERSIVEKW